MFRVGQDFASFNTRINLFGTIILIDKTKIWYKCVYFQNIRNFLAFKILSSDLEKSKVFVIFRKVPECSQHRKAVNIDEEEFEQGHGHNEGVENVPRVLKVVVRVQTDQLDAHFEGEDNGEHNVGVGQHLRELGIHRMLLQRHKHRVGDNTKCDYQIKKRILSRVH